MSCFFSCTLFPMHIFFNLKSWVSLSLSFRSFASFSSATQFFTAFLWFYLISSTRSHFLFFAFSSGFVIVHWCFDWVQFFNISYFLCQLFLFFSFFFSNTRARSVFTVMSVLGCLVWSTLVARSLSSASTLPRCSKVVTFSYWFMFCSVLARSKLLWFSCSFGMTCSRICTLYFSVTFLWLSSHYVFKFFIRTQ